MEELRMSDLYNTRLIDLIPPNMRNDPDILAACEMEDRSFFSIANMSKKVLILPNVDELDESVLDNLSWQLNVDFYEAGLSIEKKRNLIKNAVNFHMSKGTAGAVEDMLSIVFDKSYVEEWFDYGGEPYMFKIRTTDFVSQEKYEKFKKVVQTVKNTRSHLESFIIERAQDFNMTAAIGVQRLRKHEVEVQGKTRHLETELNQYHSVIIHRYKKIII